MNARFWHRVGTYIERRADAAEAREHGQVWWRDSSGRVAHGHAALDLAVVCVSDLHRLHGSRDPLPDLDVTT